MGSSLCKRRRRSNQAPLANQGENQRPVNDDNNRPRARIGGRIVRVRAMDNDDETNDVTSNSIFAILQFIRGEGGLAILRGGRDYDDDDDDDFFMGRGRPSRAFTDYVPDTTRVDGGELEATYQPLFRPDATTLNSDCHVNKRQLRRRNIKRNIPSFNAQREMGNTAHGGKYSSTHMSSLYKPFVPNSSKILFQHRHKLFCGLYSSTGEKYISACQDNYIRCYDTDGGTKHQQLKQLFCSDMGWSIIDIDLSPDEGYVVYSGWSDSVHMFNIEGSYQVHHSLHLDSHQHRFCVFSVTFSHDNREILSGASEGYIYVYDRDKQERTQKITAHEDDISAVKFADASSQFVYSGGDDGLIKVWDRRALSEHNPRPVGIFAGHRDGITSIDSKDDGRYLISNSKDQSIKLWDIRKFSTEEAQQETKRCVASQAWDYRWESVPRKVYSNRQLMKGESSLMTYRGHSVMYTLIRSYFSPPFLTGQRYIITGSACGGVYVYDVLTGRIVKVLKAHRKCVRDVSWHPYANDILSCSWDTTVRQWNYEDLDAEDDLDAAFHDKCCDGGSSSKRSRSSNTDDIISNSARRARLAQTQAARRRTRATAHAEGTASTQSRTRRERRDRDSSGDEFEEEDD